MMWQDKITKAMLQKKINAAVDEFALAICEALDHLKKDTQRALEQLDRSEKSGEAAHILASTLSYIDELHTVLLNGPVHGGLE